MKKAFWILYTYWEINWCLPLVRNNLKYELYSYNDNSRKNRTQKIVNFIKKHGMVAFIFSPYSPEHNKIKNTFGRLKNKI